MAIVDKTQCSFTTCSALQSSHLSYLLGPSDYDTYFSMQKAWAPGHKFECNIAIAYWGIRPVDFWVVHASIPSTSVNLKTKGFDHSNHFWMHFLCKQKKLKVQKFYCFQDQIKDLTELW